VGLLPHLKEKLESHVFFDVSQVLQWALDCESLAKESRNFSRSSDKPRNERHINMVEYSSESIRICFSNRRGERGERERGRGRGRESTREQMARLPLPKPLGSIYRGGGDGCLHFIPLVG
jgi:hypothetical protein